MIKSTRNSSLVFSKRKHN